MVVVDVWRYDMRIIPVSASLLQSRPKSYIGTASMFQPFPIYKLLFSLHMTKLSSHFVLLQDLLLYLHLILIIEGMCS